MFKDEQTNINIHANLNDTVIRATHRNCDLIPAFLDVIRDTPEYIQIIQHIPAYVSDDQLAEWWEQGGAVFVIEDLFVALDSYAPSGYRFGAHDGDGSDFGYWLVQDEDGEDDPLGFLREDFIESDVCMSEYLESYPADGMTLAGAFELYISARKWADKDRFYAEIEGETVEL